VTVRDPSAVFRALVEGVAAGRWDELAELYADDAIVNHPFDPLGGEPLKGRDAIEQHFAAAAKAPPLSRRVSNVVTHSTADPEVLVAEFEYRGRAPGAAAEYSIPCIFVMRVREGKIVESRDYVHHIASASARGMLSEYLDAIARNGPAVAETTGAGEG
jgi:ketosteroid isomerase-like protein